ncbi:MAG: hypothetical protein HYY48_07895 [Gammaproteobacteria bacterium]|nr:hypothetical protein [Gammaproteobacteria bacterium]
MSNSGWLIGVDDTDNLDSRGTGYRARCLAAELEQAGLGTMTGVTRHQLLVDDAIPYTSHNSSACLGLVPRQGLDRKEVIALCREYLKREAAEGSDVGLCVATHMTAMRARDFGLQAQRRILQRNEAESLAGTADIFLEGLTGTHLGEIGALAAVGLHSFGDDGRYLWVRGIRELEDCTLALGELLEQTGVDAVTTMDGDSLSDRGTSIRLGSWPRPVRVSGKAVLLVERGNGADAHWQVVGKETIKAFRP